MQIRRPPLWGHHGCGYRIVSAFQQSSVLLSAVQPSAVKLFTRPELYVIKPRLPSSFCSVTPTKINQLSSLSPRRQKLEKMLPRLPNNNTNLTPKSMKNDFCEKLISAAASMREPGLRNHGRPNSNSQIGTKSDVKKKTKMNYNVSLSAQTLSKMGS